MSYKYLYGFTNELSYDFSKVIYFGKQDRAEPELKRISEHYKESDPNHEKLLSAQYVLVTEVDTGIDLSDLEAYFIQTYKPELNTVYNSDMRTTQKLSALELEKIRPIAQELKWYLTSNNSSAIYINSTLENINERNKLVSGAAYEFESRDEIRATAFSDIKAKLKGGYGIIRPELRNSLIPTLLIVTSDEYTLEIKEPTHSRYLPSKYYEKIQFCYPGEDIFIPEIDIGISGFTKEAREYEYEEMHETDEHKETVISLFNLWRKMLLVFCEELTRREPGYSKEACIGDFISEECFFVEPGFNSNNYHLIMHIADMLLNEKLSWRDRITVHAGTLFKDIDDFLKIMEMTPENYVEYFNGLSEETLLEIDKSIAVDSLEMLIDRTKDLAENNKLRIVQ